MTQTTRLHDLPRARPVGDFDIVVAATPLARLRGLAGLDSLPTSTVLHLPRCRSVHTFGMRFALDLMWLDGAGKPVRLDEDVRPRRSRSCRTARSVLEVRAGMGRRLRDALRDAEWAPADARGRGVSLR